MAYLTQYAVQRYPPRMSEDREELKKTINETEEVTEVRAPEETRIYNAQSEQDESPRETYVTVNMTRTSTHKWIEKDESLEEVKTRVIPRQSAAETRTIMTDKATRVSPDDRTRVEDRSTKIASKETRVVDKTSDEERSGGHISAEDVSEKAKDIAQKTAAGVKQGIADLKSVKVADKSKFSRFLKIVAIFVLILIVEIGYFRFEAHVKKMPKEIKETQKELKLTQKENELLEEEIEALGDYDSVEELKASWERLKDKVDKAEAGTYY